MSSQRGNSGHVLEQKVGREMCLTCILSSCSLVLKIPKFIGNDYAASDTFGKVLWSDYFTPNFHLFFAAAILSCEKQNIMERKLDVNGILKHLNDLSQRINLTSILLRATEFYLQLENLPDQIVPELGPIVRGPSLSLSCYGLSTFTNSSNPPASAAGFTYYSSSPSCSPLPVNNASPLSPEQASPKWLSTDIQTGFSTLTSGKVADVVGAGIEFDIPVRVVMPAEKKRIPKGLGLPLMNVLPNGADSCNTNRRTANEADNVEAVRARISIPTVLSLSNEFIYSDGRNLTR
ncbi:unnamed protein product [Protopolystoma xenopodis]|uniref:Uncharacterized protein n=1 Tax=Protopolystoma xenopodis TaxID=117903 RepID=A0A448WBZ4_9PLAT|nr:unnamed protein product [Protopolystoma xenopodis]